MTIQKLSSSSKLSSAEKLKAAVIQAIEQGDPLLKFAYLGDGAQAWDSFRSGEDCNVGSREVDALSLICKAVEHQIRAGGKKINVVHLGSGNGVEIPTLFELLHMAQKDSYAAVDVSHDLLEILTRNFNEFLRRTVGEVFFFQCDADDPTHLTQICEQVRQTHPGINLVVAAGEGTLLSPDPSVLKNIRAALSSEDYALFSLDGCDPSKTGELCLQYDAEEARGFLAYAIECAKSVGALPKDTRGGFLPTVFDHEEKQLLVYYQTASGRKILILRSLKPHTEEDVKKIFIRGGLTPVKIVKTDRTSFGVICRISK